jgi:hypothetical protein
MKNCNAPSNQTTCRTPLIACAAALGATFTVSLPQPAHAEQVTPPPVPANLEVPAGNTAFLVGHATGTQNYVCLPSGAGFAYVLFTPEATLFDKNDKQITTHYFSPNLAPFDLSDLNKIRATWQASDTSTVWGKVNPGDSASHDSNPDFVADGAIAWLKVTAVGAQDGPRGGDTLSDTTFIQRLNTSGGVAPSTGCASLTDVGNQAFMPYKADYFFYKHARDHAGDGN